MKKILIAIILFLSAGKFLQAQTPQPTGLPTQFNNKFYYFTQYVEVDSGIIIPIRNTNWIPRKYQAAIQYYGGFFWGYNPSCSCWVKFRDTINTSSGSTNANIGSGYRWAIPNTNNIKTGFAGLWINIDSTSNTNGLTFKLDSAGASAYFIRRKDSVAGGYYPYSSNPLGYITSNLYTANGTLGANRTVQMDGKQLYFENGGGSWYFNLHPGSGGGRMEYWAESGSGGTYKSASIDATPDDVILGAYDAVYGLNYLHGIGSGGLATADGTGIYMSVDSFGTGKLSSISVRHDEIRIRPHQGKILIDSVQSGASTDSVLVWNASTGYVGKRPTSAFGGSSVALSSLTAATATNNIDNGDNMQVWTWNTKTTGFGLVLGMSAGTTTADGGGMFKVSRSGTHAASGVTSYSINVENTHQGTSSTNVGIDINVANGTTNKAINVTAGDVLIAGMSNFADTTNFKPVVINTTGTAGTQNKLYKATYWPGSGGGGVSISGTPADNYIAVFTNATTVEATSAFQYDGHDLIVNTFDNATSLNGLVLNNTYSGSAIVGATFQLNSTAVGRFFTSNFSNSDYGLADGMTFRVDVNTKDIGFSTGTLGSMSGPNLLVKASGDVLVTNYNFGVKTSSFGTSSIGVVAIGNGTPPGSSPANEVQLYAEDVSSSSELKVRDEAGNVTTLSPHNFTGIPGGPSEKLAWSFHSERNGEYITVDMTKAIRTIEQQSKTIEELNSRLSKLEGKKYKKKKPVKLVYTGKVKQD